MNWKSGFSEGKEIILSTSSKKGMPNANIVISLGLKDGKLLVADCQMKTTISNLKENRQVCAIGGYFRIRGKATIIQSGNYFELCTKKSKGYTVKNAILIDIDEVFDLDTGKKIKN
jgi:hypothetical protein